MKQLLVIALSALTLAGCIAEWPSNRSGPRFSGGPDIGPYYDVSNAPPSTTPPPGRPR